MSLEQAILEHASALREVAAAIKSLAGDGFAIRTAAYGEQVTGETVTATSLTEGAVRKVKGTITPEAASAMQKADELVKAHEAGERTDEELEKAVQQVEQAAQEEAAPLDYKADVRPVLMALNKAKGADALKGLLGKYGAATGDKLDAEHYAAIVADAKALIG